MRIPESDLLMLSLGEIISVIQKVLHKPKNRTEKLQKTINEKRKIKAHTCCVASVEV